MAKQRTLLKQPSISIVIPTLNEVGYISDILGDLYHQTMQPDQVIVVDGHSTDQTQELLQVWARKWPSVQVLSCPTRGVGAQRQLGGTTAVKNNDSPHDLLYFFDADTRIGQDFLATTAQAFHEHSLAAACPRYTPIFEAQDSWLYKAAVKSIFFLLNSLFWFGQNYFPSGAGPCMIVTAAHFKKLGGFNTNLLVDDLDFVHRAGTIGSFKVLKSAVFVSTRRFKKYGVWATFWQYLQISWHFVNKSTEQTNQLKYEFGSFSKKA